MHNGITIEKTGVTANETGRKMTIRSISKKR
jgi:hypothetical protein